MTKQAKIANQIKRYIRQVADAGGGKIRNSREWKNLVATVKEADAKLRKEFLSNYYPLKRLWEEETDPKRKRALEKFKKKFWAEADKVKLNYGPGYAAERYMNGFSDPEKSFNNVYEVAELANRIKSRPHIMFRGYFYPHLIKHVQEILRRGSIPKNVF